MIWVIVILVTWVDPSDQIVSMSSTDFYLMIPHMVAILVTLMITTTSHLAPSVHANHEVDKSILFITFFGVVILNVALLMASPYGDKDNNESVFFSLNLFTIVTAFLQVNKIKINILHLEILKMRAFSKFDKKPIFQVSGFRILNPQDLRILMKNCMKANHLRETFSFR